jgi:hypothetical protein
LCLAAVVAVAYRKRELEAAEIAIEAERKLGRLILAAGKAGALAKGTRGAGRPKKGGVKIPRLNDRTLLSAGVDKNLAKSARMIGRLDDDNFDERLELWRGLVLPLWRPAPLGLLAVLAGLVCSS